LIVPPFAIGLGAVFLGERLEPMAFFGFGLIALGLAVIDGRLFRRRGQGNSTPIQ
ncbi:MAG: EamA/RhaT family transporter, partial [Pseudomonadota bacterium]